jgi:hypothetical protein
LKKEKKKNKEEEKERKRSRRKEGKKERKNEGNRTSVMLVFATAAVRYHRELNPDSGRKSGK